VGRDEIRRIEKKLRKRRKLRAFFGRRAVVTCLPLLVGLLCETRALKRYLLLGFCASTQPPHQYTTITSPSTKTKCEPLTDNWPTLLADFVVAHQKCAFHFAFVCLAYLTLPRRIDFRKLNLT
jgi:hypothetical protein